MDQANTKERKHFEIYWSIYAVLLAFCIKKAKNNSHNKVRDTVQDKQHKQGNMIDKLIQGLGVSLAKTPFMILLKNKTDAPQKRALHGIFFMRVVLFGCIAVCHSGEQSGVLICFVCLHSILFLRMQYANKT